MHKCMLNRMTNYLGARAFMIWTLCAFLFLLGTWFAACSASNEGTAPAFDMSEYRKMMERQKSEQAMESDEPPGPKLTVEEEERAGDLEAQRRNLPMAALHYTKVLTADPTKNSVRLKLGQLMLQQGMFDVAATQFQDMLTRDPKSAPAHQGLGQTFLQQGKLREAEGALTKAIELDPSSWLSHNLLGLLYDQEQRHDEAITEYKVALDLHPNERGVLNNVGLAYALKGDHETAIHFFEEAVAAGSTSPKLHNNLGLAYAHRQRYADALESFKKATDEPRAYNNLGMALLGIGDAKVAVVCFEKAIELEPRYYKKAAENLRHARRVLGQSTGSALSGVPEKISCP
jgi:Flp pilus assembly protein TadD